MKNYKMVLAYDGGRYNGWQKQGNTENTIQERLEAIVSDLAGTATEVYGSGRTDAGTHAAGQVANFHMDWQGTEAALMDAINDRLPEDIAVLSLEQVAQGFHSRLHARGKLYEYTIWYGNRPPVFQRKYVFRCKTTLDIAKMEQAAQALVGEHDFRSFCANKRMKKSTVRKIYDIKFYKKEDSLTIAYYGNGFLYQMVRILTGTLIEIGEGKRSAEALPVVLAALDREQAGFTAPAKGLILREVYYTEGQETM